MAVARLTSVDFWCELSGCQHFVVWVWKSGHLNWVSVKLKVRKLFLKSLIRLLRLFWDSKRFIIDRGWWQAFFWWWWSFHIEFLDHYCLGVLTNRRHFIPWNSFDRYLQVLIIIILRGCQRLKIRKITSFSVVSTIQFSLDFYHSCGQFLLRFLVNRTALVPYRKISLQCNILIFNFDLVHWFCMRSLKTGWLILKHIEFGWVPKRSLDWVTKNYESLLGVQWNVLAGRILRLITHCLKDVAL